MERTDIVYIGSDRRDVSYDPDLFSEDTRIFWKKKSFRNIAEAYIETRGLYLNSAQFSGSGHPETKLLNKILPEISGKFKELIGEKDFKLFRVKQGWDAPTKLVNNIS